jgi:hypothetical protein
MEEIWKSIPDYNGIYEVSNLGNVKSLRFNKEKILKGGINTTGYNYVTIFKSNIKKNFCNHQLVAMAFLNHIPCGHNLVIDHINDIKTDNRLENLQIVTQRFNVKKTQDRYSSKYKGVSWSKQSKKWQSSITINGKTKHLGYFKCELAAHITYINKLKEIL